MYSVTYNGNTNAPSPYCMYLNSDDAKHTVPRPKSEIPGDAFFDTDAIWEMKPPLAIPSGIKTHIQLVDAAANANQFHIRGGVNDALYIELKANTAFVGPGGLTHSVTSPSMVLEVFVPEGEYSTLASKESSTNQYPVMYDQSQFRMDYYVSSGLKAGATNPGAADDDHTYPEAVGSGSYPSSYFVSHADSTALDAAVSIAITQAIVAAMKDPKTEKGWVLRLYALLNFAPRREWMGYGKVAPVDIIDPAGPNPPAVHNRKLKSKGIYHVDHYGHIVREVENINAGLHEDQFDTQTIQCMCHKVPAPTPDWAFPLCWVVPTAGLLSEDLIIPASAETGPAMTIRAFCDKDPGSPLSGSTPDFPKNSPDHSNFTKSYSAPYNCFLVCKYDEQVNRFTFNLFGRVDRRNWIDTDTTVSEGFEQFPNTSKDVYIGKWQASIIGASAGDIAYSWEPYGKWPPWSNAPEWSFLIEANPSYPATPHYKAPVQPTRRDPFALAGLTILAAGQKFTRADGSSFNTTDRSINQVLGFSTTTNSEVAFSEAEPKKESVDYYNKTMPGGRHKYINPGTAAVPDMCRAIDMIYPSAMSPAGPAAAQPSAGDSHDFPGWDIWPQINSYPATLGYIKASGANVQVTHTFPVYLFYDREENGDTYMGHNAKLQDVDVHRLIAPNAPALIKSSYSAYVHCELCPAGSYRSVTDEDKYTNVSKYVIPCGIIGMLRANTEPGTAIPLGAMTPPIGSTRPVPIDAVELSTIRLALRDSRGILLDNNGSWTVTLSFCFFLPDPWQGELPQYAQQLIGSRFQRPNATTQAIMQAQAARDAALMQQMQQVAKKSAKNKKKKQKRKQRKKVPINPNVGLLPLLAAPDTV